MQTFSGAGYIPYSEYVAYFKIYEPFSNTRDDVEILQMMDSIFVKKQET